MAASAVGLRIGLLGATGALGSEVLAALDGTGLHFSELRPVATDESLGQDIEFQDEIYPVQAEVPDLRGLDLAFCCAPADASLGFIREALRVEVPCIDCSGALLAAPDVPVRIAGGDPAAARVPAPVVTVPPGPALPLAIALRPLHERARIKAIRATVLDAASVGGRDSIQALSAGSVALFNQHEDLDDESLGRPIAFDCLASVGEVGASGQTSREEQTATALRRVFGVDFPVAVSAVQIPAFVGQGSALAIETEEPLDAKEAVDLLDRAPGVELWSLDAEGPNLRAAAGRDVVIVGRVRPDPTVEHGLLLWIVADVLRLTAVHAVALASERLANR